MVSVDYVLDVAGFVNSVEAALKYSVAGYAMGLYENGGTIYLLRQLGVTGVRPTTGASDDCQ